MPWPSSLTRPARKEQVQRCRPPHASNKPLCWWTDCHSPSRSTPSPSDRCGTCSSSSIPFHNVRFCPIWKNIRQWYGELLGEILKLSQPWKNVSVRIKLLGHPCNLFKVGVRTELVRQKLLAVELLVELKPAVDIFVTSYPLHEHHQHQHHYWLHDKHFDLSVVSGTGLTILFSSIQPK